MGDAGIAPCAVGPSFCVVSGNQGHDAPVAEYRLRGSPVCFLDSTRNRLGRSGDASARFA